MSPQLQAALSEFATTGLSLATACMLGALVRRRACNYRELSKKLDGMEERHRRADEGAGDGGEALGNKVKKGVTGGE